LKWEKEDSMPRKRPTPEEIISKVRQVEVLAAQGKSIADAVRAIGTTEVTYYRWRKEYGGLKTDQVRKLKELEAENARLRRAVSDLTLDRMILTEVAEWNF
jgi:transposase-like protein